MNQFASFPLGRMRSQPETRRAATAKDRPKGLLVIARLRVSFVAQVSTVREIVKVSKRILFLSRTHKVFHLWHVVHRPLSYSFVVLALIHITVVLLFGIR